jgi:hypothetical protein
MVTAGEVALLRIVAQRLAGPKADDPAAAARWLGATQAQDWPGGLLSIALRTREGSRARVEAAFDAGEIVRAWPMRGTLHVVAAEDLGWMLALTGPRMVASAATRRAGLGLDERALAQARTVAEEALSDGRALRREELGAAWRAAGLQTTESRGSHMLGHLAQTGIVCLGPVRDAQQCVVLSADWLPPPRRLQREDAVAQWAERFFRSHGPATLTDFARWTGLPLRDVRPAVQRVRARLETLTTGDDEYLLDPATPGLLAEHREAARDVHLLPGFDELLLGYGDRSATLASGHAQRVVPGANGMFLATVVDRGRVVGTWRRAGSGRARRLEATPLDAFAARTEKGIARRERELRAAGAI